MIGAELGGWFQGMPGRLLPMAAARVADSTVVSTTGTESVIIRPRKIRRVAWIFAPIIAVVFAGLGTALSGSVGDGGGVFQPSDQIAMIILGLLFAGGILLFARPKVVADRNRIQVQNIIGGYELPWNVVRELQFEPGHPWLTLELYDDEVVSVLAVQATDKDHAVEAMRALRRLYRAHHDSPRHESAREHAPDPGTGAPTDAGSAPS